jgi:Phospholipase_D-nuclease N-terminal
MARFILVLVAIGVTIYSLVDCARSGEKELRGLPKFLWLLVIVLLAPLGGILWLLVSRWSPDGPPGGGRGGRVVAPDDDPDFLRSLDDDFGGRAGDGKHRADGDDT